MNFHEISYLGAMFPLSHARTQPRSWFALPRVSVDLVYRECELMKIKLKSKLKCLLFLGVYTFNMLWTLLHPDCPSQPNYRSEDTMASAIAPSA
jgi:hypothetical protein